MNYHLNPLSVGQFSISECAMVDNVPHVTRKAMGEFLEYADPQNAIDKILERNPFINSYSVPVNMSGGDGKNYDIRVYHPVGFMSVVLSSNQPKAKLVKEAVANLVYDYSRRDKISAGLEVQIRYQKISIINKLDQVKTQFAREGLIASLRQVCQQLGEPVPDIGLLGLGVSHER